MRIRGLRGRDRRAQRLGRRSVALSQRDSSAGMCHDFAVIWLWLGFVLFVIALLAIDLGVFHRDAHEVSIREAGVWTLVWVFLGVSFTGVIYLIYGEHWFGATLSQGRVPHATGAAPQAAIQYLTGYVLEKSLSIDNIFVIAILFDRFRVAAHLRRRVLFWGILGALVLRAGMILGGTWLVTRFDWVFYIFGAYLVYAGIKVFGHDSGETNPDDSLFVRVARRLLPIAEGEHGQHFLVRVRGRFALTRLALVLLAVEGTDVVFALDSIPAILAITTDSFIVFTSNVFAILGLRSLYFVLDGMMDRFGHLKISLAFVLVFIGAKMLLHSVYVIPNLVSLGIIVLAVAVGVGLSLVHEKSDAG